MIRRLGSPGFHGIGGIGVADMGAACPGGAGNGLLNALIAYWPGNEANGNAQDAHTNALHLTDVNTVTSAGGLVYATARQYTKINTEYHARPGDDALLSAGDVDLTIAAWVRWDALSNQGIAAKYGGGGDRQYSLHYDNTLSRIVWRVSNDGTAVTEQRANTLGLPVVATWYLVVAWHDALNDVLAIQVNNGVVDSQAYALGIFDGVTVFRIGYSAVVGAFDGRIGPTMFWKSAAGGGGVLTAAQRTALYNAGAGLTYAQFTT